MSGQPAVDCYPVISEGVDEALKSVESAKEALQILLLGVYTFCSEQCHGTATLRPRRRS